MKTLARVVVLLVTLMTTAAPADSGAGETKGSLLDHLVGRWVLTGQIHGQDTTHDVTAAWVLNRHYVQLHEVSREKDAAGRPLYEAIVLLAPDAAGERYTCMWLDSTAPGGLVPESFGHALRAGNDLPFTFKDAGGTVSFINTFRYDPAADSWQWAMDNVTDGKTSPFARVRLVRG